MIVRYKRLCGYNVFYPFGFDDNGIPTERLVKRLQDKRVNEIGREKFSALCYKITDEYEKEFKNLYNRLGISTDWKLTYRTIDLATIKISQKAFLDLVNSGDCYYKKVPALWCNECITSVAQAELESKAVKTTFNYLEKK